MKVTLSKRKIYNFLIFMYMFSLLVWSDLSRTRGLYYLCALCLGCVLLIDLIKRKFSINTNGFLISFLLFAVTSVFSSLYSENVSKSIETSLSIIYNVLFLSLILNYVIANSATENLLGILCYSGFAMSIYLMCTEGVFNQIAWIIAGKRVGSSIGNENIIGEFAAISAIIAFYWYKYYANKKMLFIVLITGFIALGTASRMALIVLCVGLLGVQVLDMTFKNAMVLILRFIGVLVLFLVLLRLPMFSTLNERIQDLFILFETGESANKSINYRVMMLRIGIEQFIDSPIIGVGIGNTSVLMEGLFGNRAYGYLHNNYVELLAGCGILGFISYYYIYFKALFNLSKITKKERDAKLYILLLIILLISDVSNVTYYKAETLFIIMMSYSMRNKKQ